MEIRPELIGLFLACGLVTWIPRILPFLVLHGLTLPRLVTEWLSFIPVCLLGALFFQNLLIAQDDAFPTISTLHVFAALPTMEVAIFSKSLSWTVVTGVVTMAFLRIYL